MGGLSAGQEAFWRSTFEEHGSSIMAFLRSRLGRRDLAEDLLQETFVRAIRTATGPGSEAAPAAASVRSYLVTTAHHLILDRARRQRLVLFSELTPRDPAPVERQAAGAAAGPEAALGLRDVERLLGHATKTDLAELERHGRERRKRKTIKVFGVTVGYAWDSDASSRQFVARFGDLRQLRVLSGDRIEVTTRDGVAHRLGGGSNDVGATIVVHDRDLGAVKLAWVASSGWTSGRHPPALAPRSAAAGQGRGPRRDVRGVHPVGQPGVPGPRPAGRRVRGRGDVRRAGPDPGHREARRGRGVDRVEGRPEAAAGGHQRRGRVDPRDPGRGPALRARGDSLGGLRARPVFRRGRVFDLDERASWEMLNGSRNGIEYNVPFALIRAIEPQRGEASRVILRSGTEIVLGDGQDVSESNDGVVVIDAGGTETHFPWIEVRRIDFD